MSLPARRRRRRHLHRRAAGRLRQPARPGGPRPPPPRRTSPSACCAASRRSAPTPASRRPRSPRCCTAPRSATNAILEGKGAGVGLVTTQGFRQVLQIARSFVPGGLAGWIIWPKPEPLAALENTVEAAERIASDGTRGHPAGRGRHPAPSCAQLRDNGIEALAISLINAFANGDARAADRGDRRRGTARHPDLAVQRGAAGDARVRARADHGREQLRAAAGRPLRREPVEPARRAGARPPSCPSCAATAAWPPPTSPPSRR